MIVTVGHSTHSVEGFLRIAEQAEIDTVVDVRSHPTSKWPWWHRGEAQEWLPRGGVMYQWYPELGGWDARHADLVEWAAPRGVDLGPYLKGYFPRQRIAGQTEPGGESNLDWVSGWTSQGLHDYAWYTATEEFKAGLRTLVDRYWQSDRRAALVCSEALWWKCHRSMIADVLGAWSIPVWHAMPGSAQVKLVEHNAGPRLDRYPPEVRRSWGELPKWTN